MSHPDAEPQTVLVYVGLDLIGDGLMKLPFARALRNCYPAARITWLAGKGNSVYASVLRPLVAGLIDEVIENAGIGGGWGDIARRPLPDRRFDLILDTQRRVPTTLALKRLRHRRFVSGCARYLFSDIRPPGAPAGPYRKPAAMIGQMLELVALARFGRPDAALDIGGEVELPAAVRDEARRLLPDGARYAAMAPGAGDRVKCWPLERFAALGKRLAERGFTPVFVLGPSETEWAETLRAAVPAALLPLSRPDADLSLAPLLTIGLAARAAVCIANDSGGGHLFAASGAPLVALFGPTPAEKFAPRAPALAIVTSQQFDSDEMTGIPVEAVAEAIDGLLAEPSQRAG